MKKTVGLNVVLLFCVIFLIAGCAGLKQKNKTHPGNKNSLSKLPDIPAHRNINKSHIGAAAPAQGMMPFPSADMSKNDKDAVIQVINKSDNTSKIIQLSIGGQKKPLELGNEKLMIQATKFFSDFALGPNGPYSRSNELRNPAVQIIITRGKEKIFKGHLFGRFPDTHSFTHELIKLKLINVIDK